MITKNSSFLFRLISSRLKKAFFLFYIILIASLSTSHATKFQLWDKVTGRYLSLKQTHEKILQDIQGPQATFQIAIQDGQFSAYYFANDLSGNKYKAGNQYTFKGKECAFIIKGKYDEIIDNKSFQSNQAVRGWLEIIEEEGAIPMFFPEIVKKKNGFYMMQLTSPHAGLYIIGKLEKLPFTTLVTDPEYE